METKIEHSKIASLEPTWAPFSGWSLIFMPFGVTDAENDLFTRLRTTFGRQSLVELRGSYHLCPLPADTYHVSFCDLINQGNETLLANEQSSPLDADSSDWQTFPQWLLHAIEEAGLSKGRLMPDAVEFAFNHVTTSQGRMLGVALQPVGDALKELLKARARLQQLLFEICGLPITVYAPHITLGYFPNREIGTCADREAVPALQEHLARALTGSTARFSTMGLYAFADMISYKLLRKLCPD